MVEGQGMEAEREEEKREGRKEEGEQKERKQRREDGKKKKKSADSRTQLPGLNSGPATQELDHLE